MRRPICLFSSAFASGIFFAFYIKTIWLVLVLCGTSFIMLTLQSERLRKSSLYKCICLFLVFFILGGCFLTARENRVDKLVSMADTQVTLDGMVSSIVKIEEEKYRLVLRTVPEKSKILVSIYGNIKGLAEDYGDLAGRFVTVTGKIELPTQRRNPKTFDYRLYLKTKGIQTVMSVKPEAVTIKAEKHDRLIHFISMIRYTFNQKLSEATNEETVGIVAGMLFGDKNAMEEDIFETFQKNGTAHILAVSGIHVGILYAGANAILRPGRDLRLNLLLILMLLFYAALASFSPSVLRAAGMITLHIGSKLFCRRYDLLCSSAVIAFVLLMINPLTLFDPGFQLSFLAILSLGFVLPSAFRISQSWLAPAVSIQIGMMPVTAYSFNTFSWVALLVNLPVIFLSEMIIPIGIILMPISYISKDLFGMGASALRVLCGLMVKINDFAYHPGVSFSYVASPPLMVIFLFYVLLFFGTSEAAWIYYHRKQFKKLILCLTAITVFAFLASLCSSDDFQKASLVFVDVGQGDCLHIRTRSGKNILIDGGGSMNYDVGKKVLMPYLLKNGARKVDMIFVSHRHLDHYGGITSLAQNFTVDKIGFYEANQVLEEKIVRETGLSKDHLLYLSRGQKIFLDQNVWLQVLYPEKKSLEEYERATVDGSDENAISLILKIHYEGVTALMTGDLDTKGESRLIDSCTDEELDTDILKVAHHGSKYSSLPAFIEKVNPQVAVIQVGKNNFGHPTKEALEKYQDAGIEIFRNDKQGAIGIFTGGSKEKIMIKTIILENDQKE